MMRLIDRYMSEKAVERGGFFLTIWMHSDGVVLFCVLYRGYILVPT